MSEDYIKQLEDTIERLKKRLESDLLGKAVVNRLTSPQGIAVIASSGIDTADDVIEGGQILVGCVVFAKIKKKKDGWCGYVLDADGEDGYKYTKFAMKCKTFEEASEKCMKALAIDEPTALRIYSVVREHK